MPRYPAPDSLTQGQRDFIEAMRAAAATTPAGARAITEFPRLAPRELTELTDRGLVREAADWRFYLYADGKESELSPIAWPSHRPKLSWSSRRIILVISFWIAVALIPIILLRALA